MLSAYLRPGWSQRRQVLWQGDGAPQGAQADAQFVPVLLEVGGRTRHASHAQDHDVLAVLHREAQWLLSGEPLGRILPVVQFGAETAQRFRPHDLAATECHLKDGKRRKDLPHLLPAFRLLRFPAVKEGILHLGREDAVHEQGVHRQAEQVHVRVGALRLPDRHGVRVEHQPHGRLLPVREDAAQHVDLREQFVQLVLDDRLANRDLDQPAQRRQDGPRDAAGHAQHAARQPAGQIRRGQEAHGRSRRRRVDDEQVIIPRVVVALDAHQGEHLVEPGDDGQFAGDRGVEPFRAQEGSDAPLDLPPVAIEFCRCVQFGCLQAGRSHGTRVVPEGRGERVSERMRHVGADDQRAVATRRRKQGGRRGEGRLADAALAGKQDGAHCVRRSAGRRWRRAPPHVPRARPRTRGACAVRQPKAPRAASPPPPPTGHRSPRWVPPAP